jgi:beta-aspartyl-dipeptidase (metallo-type)
MGDPGSLARSLQVLPRRGPSLDEALPPFPTTVARLLRLPGRASLSVGADADLVVLDGEGGITDVMVGGRWHVTSGSAIIRGTFEGAPA